MKRLFSVVMLVAIALTSCNKDTYHYKNLESGYGILSFANANITVSEEVDTRAATDNYCIWVLDSNGVEIDLDKNSDDKYIQYSKVASTGIKLPAGDYTLVAQSQSSIPASEFEEPVYGAEQKFSITAGETTTIPNKIVCKLWKQVKATVEYNEFFLEHLNGKGKATVTVNNENALVYNIEGNTTNKPVSQEKRAGYFDLSRYGAEEVISLEVEFEGPMMVKEEGSNDYSLKNQKMRDAIAGIRAGQWRQLKFNMEEDEDGNAAFTISINDLVVDLPLVEDVTAGEESLGDDPNKPAGDGNIKLLNTAGLGENTVPTQTVWNSAFTDDEMDTETYPVIHISPDMNALTFYAVVPNRVAAFYVDIISDALEGAVKELCGTTTLDLVTDTAAVEAVSEIISFPYGTFVAGKGNVLEDGNEHIGIKFDLTGALDALRLAASGTESTFRMRVIDMNGKSKTIELKLFVEKSKTPEGGDDLTE